MYGESTPKKTSGPSMDLVQLEHFLAVADQHSFTGRQNASSAHTRRSVKASRSSKRSWEPVCLCAITETRG